MILPKRLPPEICRDILPHKPQKGEYQLPQAGQCALHPGCVHQRESCLKHEVHASEMLKAFRKKPGTAEMSTLTGVVMRWT